MLPESNKKFISRKTQRYYVPSNPPKKGLELSAELAITPYMIFENGVCYIRIRRGVYRQFSKI